MARKKRTLEEGDPVIIKKYANRRLYNTQSSKYITLDFLAELTRKDVDFQVVDAKSGEDITHNVLTQIIMEEENAGQNMLPVPFLRQLISLYGDSMQSMVPGFLEDAMDKFRARSDKMEDAIDRAIPSGALGDLAKQNLKMARAARDALIPQSKRKATDDNSDELDCLKKQMADIQTRIDLLDDK
ncbi:MAG: polyhydroxyalkanoate synthesis repressor PhaR [Sphingorhabdus sp.]